MRRFVIAGLVLVALIAGAIALLPIPLRAYQIRIEPIEDTRAGFRLTVLRPGSSLSRARVAAGRFARNYCARVFDTTDVVFDGTEEWLGNAVIWGGSCSR